MSDSFQKGSVILCWQCGHPIYALERGLGPSDRAGRAASAFRPLTNEDVTNLLVSRPDVPGWWQQEVARWWVSVGSYQTRHAARPVSGMPLSCPNCAQQWCRFVPRAEGAEGDKGYVIDLLDIPPLPPSARGRRVKKWDREITAEEEALRVVERPVEDSYGIQH